MGHLITVLGGVSLVVLLGGCEVDSAAGGATGDGGDDTDANLDFGLPPTPDAAVLRDASALGGFGEPCEDGNECLSGYCVEAPEGGTVCTEKCADECPPGWECRPISNTGVDTTFICVADRTDLCEPCEEHRDCDDNADLCLQIGRGSYCGEDCRVEDCPEGYECNFAIETCVETEE